MRTAMRLFVVPMFLLLVAGCVDDPGYRSLEVDDWADEYAQAEDPFLLDVRTVEEYEEAHIANATLIPHTDVEARADELPQDRDTPMFVYCRTGNRSASASETLVELGYTTVRHLDGGIEDWIEAGYPVESGPPGR